MAVRESIARRSHTAKSSQPGNRRFGAASQGIQAVPATDLQAVPNMMIDMRAGAFDPNRLAPVVLALAELPSLGWGIALLASQRTHHIACMISVLAGAARKNVGVFRCPDEARDWLEQRQVEADGQNLALSA